MKSLFKLFTVGLLFNAATLAAEPSANQTEIAKVIAQYQSALNASDANKVMALYSESPTFMPQHAPAQVGRVAVMQAYQGVFNNIDLDIEFSTHEIEVLGNTAWARTSSAGKTTILANQATITEGNNELFVFKKEQGEWKIYQYLFATNLPRQ